MNRVCEVRIQKGKGATRVKFVREDGHMGIYEPRRFLCDWLDMTIGFGDKADKVWFLTYPDMLIAYAQWF